MAGKRIKNALKSIDDKKVYSLSEAVKLVKTNATAKFDETVEISINLNVDAKKAEQNIRGVLSLPHGTGKVYKVAVFARGPKALQWGLQQQAIVKVIIKVEVSCILRGVIIIVRVRGTWINEMIEPWKSSGM